MAFIPCPHTAYVSMRWTHGSMAFSTGWWLQKSDFSSSDLQTLADDMAAHFVANYKSYLSAAVNYVETVAYDMRTEGGELKSNTTGAGACTGANPVAPIGLAVAVTKYSAHRGKNGRGRQYISGLPEGQLEAGIWLQAAADSAYNMVANMANTPRTKGWTEVIASRYHNGGPRAQAELYPVTTRIVRSLIPATQRRRFDRP